jgi:hypothetical protein
MSWVPIQWLWIGSDRTLAGRSTCLQRSCNLFVLLFALNCFFAWILRNALESLLWNFFSISLLYSSFTFKPCVFQSRLFRRGLSLYLSGCISWQLKRLRKSSAFNFQVCESRPIDFVTLNWSSESLTCRFVLSFTVFCFQSLLDNQMVCCDGSAGILIFIMLLRNCQWRFLPLLTDSALHCLAFSLRRRWRFFFQTSRLSSVHFIRQYS